MFDKLFSMTEEEKGVRKYRIIRFLGVKFKKRILSELDILKNKSKTEGLTIDEEKRFLEISFKHSLGYECNFENPKSFSEKMQWLKLNYRNPLMTTCADKVGVRDYIKEKIGEEYLVPLLGVYDSPEEINFDSLPEQFVIKVNWGSGQNIIVKDKSKLDIKDTKKKLLEWLKPESNWYFGGLEWCYKNIEPKIIIEKYISQMDDVLFDWKFYCFNSEPKSMLLVENRGKDNQTNSFFDMDLNLLPFNRGPQRRKEKISSPELWDEMVRVAKVLSKDFLFVRVDFYCIENQLKIGELTFYPGNGMENFEPREWDYKFGEMLDLSGCINAKD